MDIILSPEQVRAVHLLRCVWRGINWDTVRDHRNMTDEFVSRVTAAANEATLPRFLQTLARKLGVRSLDRDPQVIHSVHGNESDARVLDCIRRETMFLVLVMQQQNADARMKGA